MPTTTPLMMTDVRDHHASRRMLLWLTAFAIAMGVLEGAVVIYLRRLYFPEGFRFPMRAVETDIMIVELWRELATLIMLGAVGVLAGRNRGERFALFLYAFGIWDIVYYAFLRLMLGWPESLFTWDILFLLPVPWVGPVLAPCIVAATMCVVALMVVRFTDRGLPVSMTPRERALLWSGALVIIVSFTLEWVRTDGPTLWTNITQDRDLLYGLGDFVPRVYPWWIFAIGEGLGLASIALYWRRLNRPAASPAHSTGGLS
jgi:hypothetical protein